jgi:serum/glucocorticoid-regulated kinase 2
VTSTKVNFSSFKIIKQVGHGAFGKVFLATLINTSQVFALKSLKKKTLILKRQVAYAVTECSVLREVQSPFIVTLHYAFQTPNYLYLALDYCEKGDMSYHLARVGTFTEEVARFYIAELILAVEALHRCNVVYRDLKP